MAGTKTRSETKPEEVTSGPETNGEGSGDVNPNLDVTNKADVTPDGTGPDGATSDGKTEERKSAPRKKAPDTSGIKLDDIDAAALAPAELVKAATPIRARKEEQERMDFVAQRAYNKWVEADKPNLWQNMPVVTYFLDEGNELEAYRYLIKQTAAVVKNAAGEPGVARIRWGNEFTVSEEMAARLKNPDGSTGRPEVAGKTVLAWAVIDKKQAKSPATVAQENRAAREAKNG